MAAPSCPPSKCSVGPGSYPTPRPRADLLRHLVIIAHYALCPRGSLRAVSHRPARPSQRTEFHSGSAASARFGYSTALRAPRIGPAPARAVRQWTVIPAAGACAMVWRLPPRRQAAQRSFAALIHWAFPPPPRRRGCPARPRRIASLAAWRAVACPLHARVPPTPACAGRRQTGARSFNTRAPNPRRAA